MVIFITAVVALGFGLALAQTTKRSLGGPLAKTGALLLIPGVLFVLYVIWGVIAWWTIALFVAESLLVGILHGFAIRQHGHMFMITMQPIYSLAFIASMLACLGLRFL